MVKIMSLGGMVVFVGVAMLVLGKKVLHNEIVELIGGLILLAGGLVMGYALFSAMLSATGGSGRLQGTRSTTQADLATRNIAELLAEPTPSVIEQTTKLLEAEDAKSSGRESSGGPRA
jgi:hypothetical protein